jgi:ribosomal-protein-alanine N-acetyltransferase
VSTTAADIHIGRLTYSDLPQVIAVERRAFPTPWSLAMFVLEVSKHSSVCLGAQREGRLVGYVICSRYDQVWHIMNVAVDPAQRRQRIASALLCELIGAHGASDARYTLEVRPSNSPAIHLYEGLGFRAAGMRRRYYQDNGEDALIMWRTPATLDGAMDDVPGFEPRPRDASPGGERRRWWPLGGGRGRAPDRP